MIIAIDGPAASGKGTVAKRLARHYGLPHLDTGLLYRATAQAVIDGGGRVDDPQAAARAAANLDLLDFDELRLRGKDMGEAASVVAAVPEVRAALLTVQRSFAHRAAGAVLDGRDIGTVICPDADAKVFLVASADARAHRRWLELHNRGERVEHDAVLADIRRRDERDGGRASAPLMAAADAVVLDTTELDVEASYAQALAIVERQIASRGSARPAGERGPR